MSNSGFANQGLEGSAGPFAGFGRGVHQARPRRRGSIARFDTPLRQGGLSVHGASRAARSH